MKNSLREKMEIAEKTGEELMMRSGRASQPPLSETSSA